MIAPIQEEHYGTIVWANKTMDNLRKSECLCLNCKAQPECGKAKTLYDNCKYGNLALCVTRCPDWDAE